MTLEFFRALRTIYFTLIFTLTSIFGSFSFVPVRTTLR
jgi:hypothetical protein